MRLTATNLLICTLHRHTHLFKCNALKTKHTSAFKHTSKHQHSIYYTASTHTLIYIFTPIIAHAQIQMSTHEHTFATHALTHTGAHNNKHIQKKKDATRKRENTHALIHTHTKMHVGTCTSNTTHVCVYGCKQEHTQHILTINTPTLGMCVSQSACMALNQRAWLFGEDVYMYTHTCKFMYIACMSYLEV